MSVRGCIKGVLEDVETACVSGSQKCVLEGFGRCIRGPRVY